MGDSVISSFEGAGIAIYGKKRINYFEICRALCMLWIVAFWHGRAYIDGFPEFGSLIWNDLTVGALSTFVFLSGYLNGSKTIQTRHDVIEFYRRRVISLYIPFFIAAVSMLMLYYFFGAQLMTSVKQLLLSLFGLSLIIQPAPSTLWFVVMLIVYYLITPIMLKYRRVYVKAACIFCMILFKEGLKQMGVEMDSRLLWYFPIYCFGLQFAGKIPPAFSAVRLLILTVSFAAAELCGFHISNDSSYVYMVIIMFVGMVIEISKMLDKNPVAAKCGGILGRISMWAFLFHRHFFHTCMVKMGSISKTVFYCIVFPAFILVMYFAEKGYAYLSALLMKKKTSDDKGRL